MWECLVAANSEGLYQKLRFFVAGLFVYVFFFFHSVSQLPNRFRNCCVGCENGKFGFFIFFFYQKNVERY